MDNVAFFFSTLVSLGFIFSGGWLLAKIRLPLRYLASGGLVAFGIFQLDSVLVHVPNGMARIVSAFALLAINISLVYFANTANKIINAVPLERIKSDRIKRSDSDSSFRPHDVPTKNHLHG